MKWKIYFRNFLIESEFLKPKLTFSRYVWKCNRGWKMALIVMSKLLQRRSRTHLWFRQNPLQKWLWSEKTHLWNRYVLFYINIFCKIMSDYRVYFSLTIEFIIWVFSWIPLKLYGLVWILSTWYYHNSRFFSWCKTWRQQKTNIIALKVRGGHG